MSDDNSNNQLDPNIETDSLLEYRFIIGIDLGTTNSAVAYVDLRGESMDEESPSPTRRAIRRLEISQLVAAAEMGKRTVLPSFLYLPGGYDLSPQATALPWDSERDYVVGEFAREQGARVPGRLVNSAKSWLSHSRVDRTAPILPWGANTDQAANDAQQAKINKVSPVEASRRYLQHIREAWDAEMATLVDGDERIVIEENRLVEQLVILTVPASFDEVARELTLQAAQQAGITRAILLEEPLAAFYAWLSTHESEWQGRMRENQLILVCDVGGGTTDFSIIGVRAGSTGLHFNRLAVGEHLMLGGDNMDLTLGRLLESRLLGQPGSLDSQRWHQLVHACRQAKETLLGSRDRDQTEITVLGSGGQLIGGTLRDTLTQTEVEQVIIDGFFPQVDQDETPASTRRSGLTELGLPYVQDPAITRHLAAFWNRFADYLAAETGRDALSPDFLLFNGGVLAPASIRERLQTVIQSWFAASAPPEWQPEELHNPRPEAAVALGAAYYGLVRLGKGVRVGSGSPRAYYVGVGAQSDTVDTAAETQIQTAVCLAPRGVEEGFETKLEQPDFEVLANRPVAFQLFTSSTRLGDQLGDIVQLAPEEMTQLPPIQTVLRYGRKGEATRLPVQLAVRLTEVGTLELWCQSEQSGHRWQLQFDVRQLPDDDQSGHTLHQTIDQSQIEAAQHLIERAFLGDSSSANKDAGETIRPEQVRNRLEGMLELEKEAWPTPLIRALADTLLDVGCGHTRTAEHEARWLNLLGFCIRPGYGDPVDEWRIKRVWKLYFEGLHFPRNTQARTEWWIFWRRVAGGLKPGQQMELYHMARSFVEPDRRRSKASQKLPKSIGPGELLEVWMMLANFEQLPGATKTELGDALLASFAGRAPKARELWSLSRLGARNPVYGPLERVVPPATAAAWLNALVAKSLEPTTGAAQALLLLAKYTGDRSRDISTGQREAAAAWLASGPHADRYLELLRDPESALRQEEQEWIFGESLPVGLLLEGESE